MNRPTHVKINRKVAFFIQYSRTKKSKYCCHPPFQSPIFCRHSLKVLSPTLPKVMNWMLLSLPPHWGMNLMPCFWLGYEILSHSDYPIDKLSAVWLRICICPERQKRSKKFSVPTPCHIEIVIHTGKFH